MNKSANKRIKSDSVNLSYFFAKGRKKTAKFTPQFMRALGKIGLLMNIQRYGIILNVENYEECVTFYKDVLELKVMFSKVEGDFKLTCLEFGSSYLMIETEGFAEPSGKSIKSCPSKLRFNVSDIEAAYTRIKSFEISAELIIHEWGSTINIYDPDGNRICIRDEISFKRQIIA